MFIIYIHIIIFPDGGVIWNLNSGLLGMPYGQAKKTGDFVPGEVQVTLYIILHFLLDVFRHTCNKNKKQEKGVNLYH